MPNSPTISTPPVLSAHSYPLPSRPVFKVNTGNALRDSGQLDEALQCYRSALEMKPDHPHGWNNMGNALKDKGEREREKERERGSERDGEREREREWKRKRETERERELRCRQKKSNVGVE